MGDAKMDEDGMTSPIRVTGTVEVVDAAGVRHGGVSGELSYTVHTPENC